MIEYGIVKHFRYNRHYRRRFGHIYVLDKDGNPTGEEIVFYFYKGRVATLNRTRLGVMFSETNETSHPIPPRDGDLVVFIRTRGEDGRFKVDRWTHASLWEEQKALLRQSSK